MRTAEEITKEIAAKREEALGSINVALDKANETMADRLKNGPSEDKYLVKQFTGHMGIIHHLSTVQPLPIEATKIALAGLKDLAVVIDRLNWVNSACFVIIADDMIQHFEDVMRLKDELLASSPEVVNDVHKGLGLSAGPTNTIH